MGLIFQTQNPIHQSNGAIDDVLTGVDSAAIEGEDENQIVVTGINIDMVELVKKLKKKVGFSTILTATVIDGDKKDKDKDDDGDEELKVWPNFHVRVPPY